LTGYEKIASRNYDEVMSGHVSPLLASIIENWVENETILGNLSFFGKDFWYIPKWVESRMRRKRARRRKSMAPQLTPMPSLRKQVSGSQFSNRNKS